jgi:hypothetical protein
MGSGGAASRRAFRWIDVVRWIWIVLLVLLALVCVAMAPVSGGFTLPMALVAGGLALWLARGGPQVVPGRVATGLVATGMGGILLMAAALLLL